MKLTRTAIVDELIRRGLAFTQTPEAIELTAGWCVRSGGGIADRSCEWFLWRCGLEGRKRGV